MIKTYHMKDEQDRIREIYFRNEELKPDDLFGPQSDSHGFSYIYARQQYQEMGETMGLDRLTELEEKSSERDCPITTRWGSQE